MPVSVDDFLWEGTGHHATGTSVVVTHPDGGGTTAGTTVLIGVHTSGTTVTVPSGWRAVTSATAPVNIMCKSDIGAGETSWTVTLAASDSAGWYVAEIDNLNLVDPIDVITGTVTPSSTNNGATRSVGPSSNNSSSSGALLALFGAVKAGASDVQSWGSWTDSFVETFDSEPAGVVGRQIAAARRFVTDTWTTWSVTATLTTSVASATTAGSLVYLRSADASINAPLSGFTGYEFGTHAGFANPAAGSTSTSRSPSNPISGLSVPLGTWGTGYSVQAGSARGSGFGLKIVAAGSAAAVPVAGAAGFSFACGFDVGVESGTGTPQIAVIVRSGTDLEILYDVAAEKVGVKWTGGSVEWQTGTTPLSSAAAAWVDIRCRSIGTTSHVDWSIETGVGSQTSPTDLTEAASTLTELWLGATGAGHTVTAHYDNPVCSQQYVAYPVGPHTVRRLVPETTGATVSGTATNFSRFTANGTLAAISVDTAGALLDEAPPTISASSDGVVQTAVAASDYLNFPMTTYTLASDEIIAGVRAYASLWGGTGSGTGTLGFRGFDGTTETTFYAASPSYDADSLTAASSTYPLWYSANWAGGVSGNWTPTRLDATALRLGFSTDATPDMGASALYLEVAIRKTPVYRQITEGEADEFTVDIRVHPYNSASISYLLESTDATRGATFNYSISGTPQTPVYVAAASTEEVVVNAASFGEISDVSLEPDA